MRSPSRPPELIILSAGPPLVAALLNFVHLFFLQHPELRPGRSFVDAALAPRLLKLGVLFVALQIAVSVAFQSDVVVAAAVVGPEAAAVYSVAARVFLFVPSLIAIVQAHVWPAYGEALNRGDVHWVTRWLRRSIIGALVASASASAILFVASPWIFRILTADTLTMPTALLLGFAVWAVVSSAFNAVGILLNAASVIGFQVAVALAMGATSIGLSIVFANVFGVSGVIWGTVVAYVLVTGIPISLYLPRFLPMLATRGSSSVATGGAPS